jgi:hypothetical protein
MLNAQHNNSGSLLQSMQELIAVCRRINLYGAA